MGKKPSAETELRTLRRQHNETCRELTSTRLQLAEYRGRASKAEQEVAEWKRRFDALLAREPPASAEG